MNPLFIFELLLDLKPFLLSHILVTVVNATSNAEAQEGSQRGQQGPEFGVALQLLVRKCHFGHKDRHDEADGGYEPDHVDVAGADAEGRVKSQPFCDLVAKKNPSEFSNNERG